MTCSVAGCDKERYVKTSTLCKKHYLYNWRHGEVKRTRFEPNEIEFCSDYALVHLYNRSGKVVAKAIIDLEDVDKVCGYRWMFSTTGYVVNAKAGKIHNVIMGVRARHDHKNNQPLDNRKENLRPCTNQENAFNSLIHKDSTSGVKGVSWNKQYGKYMAYICCSNKREKLGFFTDVIEAAIAYNNAAIRLFGEFAKVNDIERLRRDRDIAKYLKEVIWPLPQPTTQGVMKNGTATAEF